jgi:citrate lyase subunit beta/citryl-CoA lyase
MHPSQVLFPGAQQPVSLPVCDHYAGSEKLMRKSMALQQSSVPCSTSPSTAKTAPPPAMKPRTPNWSPHSSPADNVHRRIGARVHDVGHAHFEQDVAIICGGAARELAYLMLPKPEGLADVLRALRIDPPRRQAAAVRDLPVHVLIETHGAWPTPGDRRPAAGAVAVVRHHGFRLRALRRHSRQRHALAGQFDHPLVRAPSWRLPPPAMRTARCRRIT